MPPPAYAASPDPVLASLMAQLKASQQEALQLKVQLASPSGMYRLRGALAGVPGGPSVAAPTANSRVHRLLTFDTRGLFSIA